MTQSRWHRVIDAYREPQMLAVLFMGFSSGLPLPLTVGTLSIWLAQSGVTRTEIGLFALVGISYNFKFVWSPLIDRLPLPFLTARLGRRRGWAIFLQVLLAAAIFGLSLTDPAVNAARTALLAVIVAFLSASQDIVIDAYRIELLTEEQQGAGAAATQWGYRFGMIAASAGALYAVAYGGWHLAYGLMALLMGRRHGDGADDARTGCGADRNPYERQCAPKNRRMAEYGGRRAVRRFLHAQGLGGDRAVHRPL